MKVSPVLGLVLTLLLSSSSTPLHKEAIVKEGHRVVVVEYAKEADGTTKVVISPQEDAVPSAADKKQAEGATSSGLCDTVGKCMNKISNDFTKTKDTFTKPAEQVEDDAKEPVNKATETEKTETKDTFYGRAMEKLPGHTVGEFLVKSIDGVTRGLIGMVKKCAGNVVAVVKDGTSKHFDIIDSPKRIGEDISRNVSNQAEHVKELAKETVNCVKEVLGQKLLNDIVNRFILCRDKMGSVAGLVHVLGFSTAYGMCVWVTFVSSYVLGRCLSRQVFGMVQSRMYAVYFRALGYCVSVALLGQVVSEKSEVLASRIGMVQSLSLVSALLMVLINMMLLEPEATKAMYKRMRLEKEEGKGIRVALSKDGMVDGGGAVVRSSANGRGVRVAVAAKDGMVDGVGGDTMVRSAANGKRVPSKDGMINGGSSTVARSTVVERQDILRLNEKLKRLNAYSSALNLFTLVALTWHMAYMGQQL